MTILEEAENRKGDIVRTLNEWSIENLRDFPWRRKVTPYGILVAEFLLRRTTASAVERVYDEFIKSYPSIEVLASANPEDLENSLRTLGYHKQRSRMIGQSCRFILKQYGGKIPKDSESLISVPNIGPYIAGAILSLGFGIRAPMVDSNAERILRRFFLTHLPDRGVNKILTRVAERLVPDIDHQRFNLALIDLGAVICTYRKPHCNVCPLKSICDYPRT